MGSNRNSSKQQHFVFSSYTQGIYFCYGCFQQFMQLYYHLLLSAWRAGSVCIVCSPACSEPTSSCQLNSCYRRDSYITHHVYCHGVALTAYVYLRLPPQSPSNSYCENTSPQAGPQAGQQMGRFFQDKIEHRQKNYYQIQTMIRLQSQSALLHQGQSLVHSECSQGNIYIFLYLEVNCIVVLDSS